MLPVLFHLGSVPVGTHDFFVLLGVAGAVAVFVAETRRRSIRDERLVWVVLGALVTGGLFARLSTAWRYLAAAPEPGLLGAWLYGGRSVLGGLAGAYLGVVVTKRIVGYRSSTGDLFAPAVALGLAVGRVGCFLTEQIGTPTSFPWGLTVSPETAAAMPYCPHCAAGVPLHPSFLYEIVFHLVMFGVLMRLRHRPLPEGDRFKLFLLAYGMFRFLVEFVRANPPLVGPLSGSQVFLMFTVPLLALYFLRGARAGAYRLVPT